MPHQSSHLGAQWKCASSLVLACPTSSPESHRADRFFTFPHLGWTVSPPSSYKNLPRPMSPPTSPSSPRSSWGWPTDWTDVSLFPVAGSPPLCAAVHLSLPPKSPLPPCHQQCATVSTAATTLPSASPVPHQYSCCCPRYTSSADEPVPTTQPWPPSMQWPAGACLRIVRRAWAPWAISGHGLSQQCGLQGIWAHPLLGDFLSFSNYFKYRDVFQILKIYRNSCVQTSQNKCFWNPQEQSCPINLIAPSFSH
jgi:hypothetical protein